MNKYVKIASPVLVIISLILILLLKSIPSGKLWKNYSVLYVQKDCEDSLVISALEKAGINNVICLSGQFLPALFSENSVEVSMLRLNYDNPDFSYLQKRNALFYDKSEAYRLYYIPSEQKSKLTDAIRTLEAAHIQCGTDSDSAYPWLLPLIVFLLAGMLFVFVKNKLPFICGTVIPLVFIYSNPFYPVALASCLIILCLFFIANLWKRKGSFEKLIKRPEILIMPAVAFISCFAGSIKTGCLSIIAIIGILSSLIFCYYTEDFFRNKKSFVPVFIRPAKRISIFAGKAFISMTTVSVSALLLIAVFILTSSDSVRSHISKLLLPASTSNISDELPQFEDFYRWNWNLRTYPYISINDGKVGIKDGVETVDFMHYKENEQTGIIELYEEELSYNGEFKESVYNDIDSLKFNAVEKLMKSEGDDFSAGFTATNSYHINLFGIIMSFICLFILLFIYFSIIIRKGVNK